MNKLDKACEDTHIYFYFLFYFLLLSFPFFFFPLFPHIALHHSAMPKDVILSWECILNNLDSVMVFRERETALY